MTGLFDLSGKVAIVTGSTRGIGRGIAEELARAGASVVVSSESATDTHKTELAFSAAGYDACGICCDVTDVTALKRLVAGTIAHFGGIDILVCNAGITGAAGSWTLDDFDRVMAINLRSVVALTGCALPHMAKRSGGSAILLSSISALRGNAAINAYALSKAGLAQLARNLAVQWGPQGVRVNAISPGFICTELSAPLLADKAFMTRRMAMTPLRRPGEVGDVAGAALFLAATASAYVTGHNLVVDGGTVITDGS